MSAQREYTVEQLESILRRSGWVECDIAACNCGSWHHRYGLPERWQEIKDLLIEAEVLDNSTGNRPIEAIRKLIMQRDDAWLAIINARAALAQEAQR